MKTYQEQTIEVKKAMKVIIEQVISLIGFEVDTTKENINYFDSRVYAKKDKEEIIIAIDRDKLSVYGLFPYGPEGEIFFHEERPRISVSSTKTPERIASDIQKRFLPDYRKLFSKIEEKIEERTNNLNIQEKNLVMLKGSKLDENEKRSKCLSIYSFIKELDGYGDIRGGKHKCDIDLRSIPYETAQKIIEILRKAPKRKEEV